VEARLDPSERLTPGAGILARAFNPFVYVAGGKALFVGLLAILAAGYIGSLSGTHFDGVLDCHTAQSAPTYVFLAEGIIAWLCLSAVLFGLGRSFSKTAFRAIDLFGTQAMARWPTLIAAAAALAPPLQRLLAYFVQQLPAMPTLASLPAGDLALGGAAMLLILLATVWMVALMYQSYSTCCNIRGGSAIGSFIAGVIVAEVVSKVVLAGLFSV
jgi:hypothetical protein